MLRLSVVAFGLVVLLAAWPAGGQPVSRAGAPTGEKQSGSDYVAKAFTTEDGLPQNVVRSVERGLDGSLWVGTYDGLARYDGHSFERFNAAEIEGLAGNRIVALHQAPDSTLWIGTETGLSVWRNGQFQQIPGIGYVNNLEGGPEGAVWFKEEGVDQVHHSVSGDIGSEDIPSIPLPDSLDGAGQPLPVERDSVWMVGRHGESLDLFLWNGTTLTRPAWINEIVGPLNGPVQLEMGLDGRLWIASGSRVFSIRHRRARRYSFNGRRLAELRIGPSGRPWIATYDEGLFRLSGETFQQIEVGGKLSALFDLTRDESGQWWVGTQGNGLVRLRPRLFADVGAAVSGRPPARGIYTDSGTVWVALTGNEGILEIAADQSGWERRIDRHSSPRGIRYLWTIGRGRTGPLAVGGGGGLAWWEEGGFKNEPRISSTLTAMHRDASGGLWIGLKKGSLYRFQSGMLTQVLPADRVDARINALHRAGDGTLWIGTQSRGIARLAGDSLLESETRPSDDSLMVTGSVTMTDSVTWYDTDDGLPYISVRDVYETADGTIWIGTYGGGMARFEGSDSDGPAFAPVTPSDGLPSGTINAIHEAPVGIFWMTSNEGVFRVPRAELAAVADGTQERVYPRVFGADDGMPDRECNGPFEPSIAEDTQGRLWIPTMKGPTVVDPSREALRVPESIPVRIAEVRADGTPVPLDSLQLEPSTYRVAIDFTGVSLRYGEDLSFRYRLDGGEWRPGRSQRTVEYTGLGPGTHQFEVQATVQGETWHTLDRPLAITVLPHFYQTWWFRFAIGAWVVIIGFAIYRFRTYQLRRRKAALEETVAERTRELRERKERLADQIDTLKGAMARVEAGNLDVEVDAQRSDELGELARSFNQMVSDLRERSLLQRHVGEHTLEMVRSTDDLGATQLGEGRIREVAILFTDIRGSTERIEHTDPESFVQQLNRTFSRQAETANRFGGSIDKFVGDAMIVLFTGEKALRRALQCGVEIQCGFQEDPVSSSFFDGLGIGVNYGPVLMGNLGGEERLDYSVIGTEVNLCARLCGAAGPGQILVRSDLVERRGLSDEIRVDSIGKRGFKGFDRPFRIAEVLYECEEA